MSTDIKDGIYYNMAEQDYRALPFANYSAVKTLCLGGTPAHYLAKQQGDDTDSDSKAFGRLVHSALLQPETFEKVEKLPDNIKRRAGKEWEELRVAFPEKEFLPPAEWNKFVLDRDIAFRIRDSIVNDPVAGNFFKNIGTEVTAIWTDKETGVRCKARLDILEKGMAFIGDVKTTSRFIPFQITRSAYYFGYHVQVAMYTDAICTLHNISLEDPPNFWYIWIESDPPYLPLISNGHSAHDERTDAWGPLSYLELGREQYHGALKVIADCQNRCEWEGHPMQPFDMVIPRVAGWEAIYGT